MIEEKTPDANADTASSKSSSEVKVFLLGCYHLLMMLLFVYLLIMVWPAKITTANGETSVVETLNIFGWSFSLGTEARFLLLVIIASTLGSFIHAATSFVSYVGNKRLVMSWAWWYIIRPFIGMALALVFYFVIRGGLLSTSSSAGEISIFGIVAVAGLVGMFSKQATDKLGEVFETLFRTKDGGGDDERKDKLKAKIVVSEKMLPVNKITSFVIMKTKQLNEIKIEELYDLLNETVTRVPVFDEDYILKYVIHQSIIYKFIFEKSIMAFHEGKSFSVNELTLEDFLNHPGIKELVSDAIAFLPKTATVIKAKEEMEKIKNCQDVFITETGKREEKVIGWLTNVEIGKCLS